MFLSNKTFSRNTKIGGVESENKVNNAKLVNNENTPSYLAEQKPNLVATSSSGGFSVVNRDNWFNSVRLSQDKNENQQEKSSNFSKISASRFKKDTTHRPAVLSKHNFSHHDPSYKVRAASSSLNRKNEDKFLFRPPTHAVMHAPTPKYLDSDQNQVDDSATLEISDKIRKGYILKQEKDSDSNSKAKRPSLNRVKRVNKIPLGKKDWNIISQSRSTSRGKQLSTK